MSEHRRIGPADRFLSPAGRTWLYGVALAVLPLLVSLGLVSESDVPLWAALVGAVLVPGVALANRPTRNAPETRRETRF